MQLVCAAVVNGLGKFRVGMPRALPTVGSAVNSTSYTVCGTMIVEGVTVGLSVPVYCRSSAQQFRYVIVQSLYSSAEQLCIADVSVYPISEYAETFVLVQQ